jgi:Tfp pilus assembly PilM family ATPase
VGRRMILGVDVGASRLRVACGEWIPGRGVAIRAVAARDVVDDAGSDAEFGEIHAILLEEALSDLAVRRGACVAALGIPYAEIRLLNLPKMGHAERRRAALLALSDPQFDTRNRLTRLHPVSAATGAIAAATVDRDALEARLRVLRFAGLRVKGVDYDGCALGRVFCEYDAVLDIGLRVTRLHAFRDGVPVTWMLNVGGAAITSAVAADLSVDLASAEKRKRILGIAGAGESALDAIVEAVSRACNAARSAQERWSRVAMVGNGARLPGLAERLSAALNVRVTLPIPELMRSAASAETLASVAPDWALACALTTWSFA